MKKINLLFCITLITLITAACSNPFWPDIDFGDGTTSFTPDPVAPVITVQPDVKLIQDGQEAFYYMQDFVIDEYSALKVTATKTDNGILTYQWYSFIEGEDGTPVSGETSESFKPPTNVPVETYYYVIVTNTLNNKTATVKSNVVKVIILEPVIPPFIQELHILISPPVKNTQPAETAVIVDDDGRFNISDIEWSTANVPMEQGDEFLALTVYTVKITFTANDDNLFGYINHLIHTATINGFNYYQHQDIMSISRSEDGKTLTLSRTFPATLDKDVESVVVKTPPKLIYTHGDTFDCTALVVTLVYEGGEPEDVPYADFNSKGLSIVPAHGIVLYRSVYDGENITISFGGGFVNANTEDYTLTVEKKTLLVTDVSHTKKYDSTVDADNVIVQLTGILAIDENDVEVGEVTAYYPLADAGTTSIFIDNVDLTGSAAQNYIVTPPGSPQTVVGITKADGAAVSKPALDIKTDDSLTVIASKVSAPVYNDQTIQYRLLDADSVVIHDWQDSNAFSGLDPAITYFVEARSKENTNFEAGGINKSDGINIGSPEALSISIQTIKDAALTLDSVMDINNIRIFRSGGQVEITVDVDNENNTIEDYTIEYYFNSALITKGVSGDNGEILTLSVDQSNPNYNLDIDIINKHFITVIVSKDGEPPSSAKFVFEVKEN